MSKELEALNKIAGITNYDGGKNLKALGNSHKKEFGLIESALKRLEEHDKIFKKYNINDIWLEPALYVIKNHFPMDTETQLKKLKALEFLKEKCEFDFLEIRINGELAKYEIHIRPKNKEQLLFNCLALYPKIQEEYELLKEMLL